MAGGGRSKKKIANDKKKKGGEKVERKKTIVTIAKAKKQQDEPPHRPSKYVGVSWRKKNKKWQAEINIDGKSKFLGHFDNEKGAAYKYDEQAAIIGKPVNFPQHEGQEQAVKFAPMRKDRSKMRDASWQCKLVGVSWDKKAKKWMAKSKR